MPVNISEEALQLIREEVDRQIAKGKRPSTRPPLETPTFQERPPFPEAPPQQPPFPSEFPQAPFQPQIPPTAPVPQFQPPLAQKPIQPPTPWLRTDLEPWEQPKAIAEKSMELLGRGIAKVPVLPKALEFAAPVFEFIHEKIEKPWAAALTSTFSPAIPWREGESWIAHEKREYEAWKAPTYVKGLAEFSMPLWWAPWVGWAGKGAKALMGANRMGKFARSVPVKSFEAMMPSYDVLAQNIPNNIAKKLALWAENKPVLHQMVKSVGGAAAFTRRNPQTIADKAKNYAVFYGIQKDMGDNIVRAMMPDLYVKSIVKGSLKREKELLKFFDEEIIKGNSFNAKVGAVTTDATHPGVIVNGKVSLFADDVWQNPNSYKWTDKIAFEYVKQGHETINWFVNWAKNHGVEIPSTRKGLQVVGDVIQEHITRIAKGVEVDARFIRLGKTDPFRAMVHETMMEGVEAGVKYGGSFADRIQLLSNAITKKVARNKFSKHVRELGKTVRQRLEDADPTFYQGLAGAQNRVKVLADTMAALKLAAPFKGGYRPIHRNVFNTLRSEFPDLADGVFESLTVNPHILAESIKGISLSAQGIAGKNSKPLIEALLALPERASIQDAMDVVLRFASNEQKAIRMVERLYKKQAVKEGLFYKEKVKALTESVEIIARKEGEGLKQLLVEKNRLLRYFGAKPERHEAIFSRFAGLKGRIFDEDVVRAIEPMMLDRGRTWLKGMAELSGASRTLVAALDLSAPFIQGTMVFGKNPVVWAKATQKMLNIARNPANLFTELASRKASILNRVTHGGSTAMIDYFEAMPLLRRVAGKIKGERVVTETYGRAEAAFLGFGEIARDEMWKVGEMMILKKGLSEAAADTQLRELAKGLDKMTGVMSPTALGIGMTQQQFESAWMFFAPRYTRASASFVADMLRGGFTGAEARKALGGLLLGATTMYMGITSATGQRPNLDPRSAKFMTIKIGDRHVGVGGFSYSLMRFMANTIATAAEEPELLSPLNLSRVDNPFYKFMYSRTAPLTGLTFGLAIEHKNYFGEPFEDVLDYAAFLADKVLPIALQSSMPWEYKEWMDKSLTPLTTATEFAGLRTFPKSTWEVRDEAREKLALDTYNKPWKQITRAEQREIEADSQFLGRLDEEISKRTLQRGDPEDVLFNQWQDEIDTVKDLRDERINNVAQAAQIDGDTYQFRRRIDDVENDYAAVLNHINENTRYSPIMEILDKPKTDEQMSQMNYLDAAYNIWTQVRYSKGDTKWGRMQNELGEPIWENVEKFREWFGNQYGEDALRYAEEERQLAGRDLPPLYLELKKAKRVMKEYWAVSDWYIETILRGREPRTESAKRRMQAFVGRQKKILRQTNSEIAKYYDMFYKEQ